MSEDDDYESLSSSHAMATHMVAGAAAGIMEHCIMYPVDCVKTRMQVLVPDPRANYRNVVHAFYRIIRYEGLLMTIRGINTTVYGAGPAHALYYACYEKFKATLSRSGHSNHLVHGVAGVFATVLHDAVMTPADAVKQRMQVFDSPYKSTMDCVRTVYRNEGVRAFYRSYSTQLTMNIPFVSLHFIVYEYAQDILNPDRQYNPRSHILSGAAAGAIAAAATTPLDVCKTLLNTQSIGTPGTNSGAVQVITGIPQAFATIYRYRGFRGFFSGVTARMLSQSPATAISWFVYEFFKFFISHGGHITSADKNGSSPSSTLAVSPVVPVHE